MHSVKSKKKVQCHCCKRKLTCVFSVCRCRRMYCHICVDPFAHNCEKLKDFEFKSDVTLMKDESKCRDTDLLSLSSFN